MNIFNLPPLPLPDELTTILAESGNIRIERIVSTGQTSDWYDQTETEFVVLLEGNAVIEYLNSKTVTLVFIGEVNPKKIETIKAIFDTVTFAPFMASVTRLGTFSRGTLWWAGLRDDKPLMDLQREIEHKLALCGFEMDGRKYSPHITLGREVMTDAKPWNIAPLGETVSVIDMMKSERIGGKLTYTVIARNR
ncbi:MAG: RNA 2',3'-cyclic phosphodiesterase [Synergistaceae bacterium]|jgi:2'-5' RNA ligase|nr:RNA 2',3'-cyclic phosphodiesterase [Synergistaceae bacterium]